MSSLASLVLCACGGGGGGGDAPPPVQPTPLPATVSITAPAKAQSTGNVAFAPSFAGSNGLTFKWEFGDGTAASAEPAPSHAFAQPGDYQVKLTVTDASGASRNASFDITVNNQANVRGLTCSGADDAGWCWARNVAGNGDLLNDVSFNGQTAWAVGASGALYKSLDGGKTWASKFAGVGERGKQVAFADQNRGWALTESGKLYTSANGGDAWTPQLDAAGATSLTVLDAQRVIVNTYPTAKISDDGGQSWRTIPNGVSTVTKSGVIWGGQSRSTDGGKTFVPYGSLNLFVDSAQFPVESAGPLMVVNDDVAFRQIITHGYISANYTYSNAIAVTVDGGVTWTRRTTDGLGDGLSYPSPTQRSPAKIYAASADKLWALDGARVARSLDGGRSWSNLPRGPWPEYTGWFASWIVDNGVADLDNPDAFTMVVAEGLAGDAGKAVFRTVDGGLSWKRYAPPGVGLQQYPPRMSRIGPQSFIWQSSSDYAHAYASNAVYRTDDDGASWTQLSGANLATSAVANIAFWDDKRGLAVQFNGDLLSTTDGGQNWKVLSAGGARDGYPRPLLQTFDSTAWLLRRTAESGSNTLSVSTDRGATWTAHNTVFGGATLTAMNFFDAKRGIVLAEENYSTRSVFTTIDGGATWVKSSALSISGLAGAARIMRLGGGLHVTRDAGASWTAATLPTVLESLTDAKLVDGLNGWVVGSRRNTYPNPDTGVVLATQDGGLTWTEKTLPAGTPPLNALHFQTPQLGWLVGNAGTVLMTRDGGATWTKQDVGPTTRDFTAVHFNSSKTGWLGGSLGELMATGTGGY